MQSDFYNELGILSLHVASSAPQLSKGEKVESNKNNDACKSSKTRWLFILEVRNCESWRFCRPDQTRPEQTSGKHGISGNSFKLCVNTLISTKLWLNATTARSKTSLSTQSLRTRPLMLGGFVCFLITFLQIAFDNAKNFTSSFYFLWLPLFFFFAACVGWSTKCRKPFRNVWRAAFFMPHKNIPSKMNSSVDSTSTEPHTRLFFSD